MFPSQCEVIHLTFYCLAAEIIPGCFLLEESMAVNPKLILIASELAGNEKVRKTLLRGL